MYYMYIIYIYCLLLIAGAWKLHSCTSAESWGG